MRERRPLIVGNWKMHRSVGEALALVAPLRRGLAGAARGLAEVAVCPSFTLLSAVGQALADSEIALGAQNCFWEAQGAYTGEVSPTQLADLGCRFVILGHSERRHLGETSAQVDRKARAALSAGLTPIVCVGESQAERGANQTFAVVSRQIEQSVGGLSPAEAEGLVLAYEPVWAIGTGQHATSAQAQEVHGALRAQLTQLFGGAVAEGVRLLYGGSVKPGNARGLLAERDVDGALVGGASLSAEDFMEIVRAAG